MNSTEDFGLEFVLQLRTAEVHYESASFRGLGDLVWLFMFAQITIKGLLKFFFLNIGLFLDGPLLLLIFVLSLLELKLLFMHLLMASVFEVSAEERVIIIVFGS